MGSMSYRARIAVLWLVGPVLESAHLILIHGEERWLERHGNLMMHSGFYYIIPVVFCFLTVVVKDKVNKWMNLVVGILNLFFLNLVNFLEDGIGVIAYTGPPVAIEQTIMIGLRVVITAFIPWYAFRWIKMKEA